MTHLEYNGWWNYETWVVNLWMDNDQNSQEQWHARAAELLEASEPGEVLTKEEEAIKALEQEIKLGHEEALPTLEGFAADLLNGAMSEVNWREIATHYINDAIEEKKSQAT